MLDCPFLEAIYLVTPLDYLLLKFVDNSLMPGSLRLLRAFKIKVSFLDSFDLTFALNNL